MVRRWGHENRHPQRVRCRALPTNRPGDDLAAAITTTLTGQGASLRDGDVVVIASKVVSIGEHRHRDLGTVSPGPGARGWQPARASPPRSSIARTRSAQLIPPQPKSGG